MFVVDPRKRTGPSSRLASAAAASATCTRCAAAHNSLRAVSSCVTTLARGSPNVHGTSCCTSSAACAGLPAGVVGALGQERVRTVRAPLPPHTSLRGRRAKRDVAMRARGQWAHMRRTRRRPSNTHRVGRFRGMATSLTMPRRAFFGVQGVLSVKIMSYLPFCVRAGAFALAARCAHWREWVGARRDGCGLV